MRSLSASKSAFSTLQAASAPSHTTVVGMSMMPRRCTTRRQTAAGWAGGYPPMKPGGSSRVISEKVTGYDPEHEVHEGV